MTSMRSADSAHYLADAYYETTSFELSFNPHHDIYTLINYTGGPEDFVRRLDTIFQPNLNPDGASRFVDNAALSSFSTIFNPGNEPSFASPYLFNFARRQDLSVQRSRYVAKTYYNTQPDGLPGNSDAGAMQTWLLWNMIGLYPLTGQTTFLITSPWFSMNIDLGNDKTLNITTTGGNSDTAYYVQSLRVNGFVFPHPLNVQLAAFSGEPFPPEHVPSIPLLTMAANSEINRQDWNKPWLTWDDVFANGGSMEYVLGSSPSGWSTDGDLPPSPAS